MTSSTRLRSFSLTFAEPFRTCETVPTETPAASAICFVVSGSFSDVFKTSPKQIPHDKALTYCRTEDLCRASLSETAFSALLPCHPIHKHLDEAIEIDVGLHLDGDCIVTAFPASLRTHGDTVIRPM